MGQPIKIDLHTYRRSRPAWALRLLLGLRCIRYRRRWGVANARAWRWCAPARADASVFVALRQQRTRIVLVQTRQVEPKVFIVIVRGHVQPLRAQTKIGRGEKPKVLSARVPYRPDSIGESISHLFGFPCFDVAHKD